LKVDYNQVQELTGELTRSIEGKVPTV